MDQHRIEFEKDTTKTGFRLERFEVLNWGTFNSHIWSFEMNGYNSLLTGDIGSGKSTLVDALLTLLVPSQKITYNKAAGAEYRERSLLSYVRGAYKNVQSEIDHHKKSIFLREGNTYSVLLSSFYNSGYLQRVTLAQVLWVVNQEVKKFFVVSGQDLDITTHFTVFDGQIPKLRKRLKSIQDTEVFEGFPAYSSKFRSLFGLQSEKALDLFYQTVSMKSIGGLNDFIRTHMIEKSNIGDRIQSLKNHFENLTLAYEAVQRAKKQLNMLQPLIKDADEYDIVNGKVADLNLCLKALPVFIALRQIELTETKMKEELQKSEKLGLRKDVILKEIESLREKEKGLDVSIRDNAAGREIGDIEGEIKILEESKTRKLKAEDEFFSCLDGLELPRAVDEEMFHNVLDKARELETLIQGEAKSLSDERDKLVGEAHSLVDQYNNIRTELTSLQQRQSQIPAANMKIRAMLLDDLGLTDSEVPFVGELLKVREKEGKWEGAIERVLHSFGLSVLIPETQYKRVSDYVDKTNLKGRLVYYRMSEKMHRAPKAPGHDSLTDKVEIKAKSLYSNWLYNELVERFDYACCETIEQFQGSPRAITAQGQIKGGRNRHEKDDRVDITDRTHYILGWSNAEKIKAIMRDEKTLAERMQALKKKIDEKDKGLAELGTKQVLLRDVLKFKIYEDINWKKEAAEIASWQELKKGIEESSDQLKRLNEEISQVREDIKKKEADRSELDQKIGSSNTSIITMQNNLEEFAREAEAIPPHERVEHFNKLAPFISEVSLVLENIKKAATEIREKIEKAKAEKEKRQMKLSGDIIRQIAAYKTDFPAETSEVDTAIEAIPDFRKMLKQVIEEDLPRFEDRFKDELNKGVINDIALFKSELYNDLDEIETKIAAINRSLKSIEYNEGTFIELSSARTPDTDVREFQVQLQRCLENTLGATDLYDEEKFLRVKDILDRFNSGDATDVNWTNKVTDVRNWVNFHAVERYINDNTEKEFYSDSSGKSGGQKEKLAYTILASALAYQFGLEWGRAKSRSFRFAVIDEAFARGSDDSTRYGLELFKKLNLQLLIVTPLQKINIIENYIDAVHYIHNEGGNNSIVRNLTIEEYKAGKERELQKTGTTGDRL